MDSKTGRIYEVTEEEAKRRGLVPIPKKDEGRVLSMNRRDRRAWAARQRHAASKSARGE
jgi:hypothetical protein